MQKKNEPQLKPQTFHTKENSKQVVDINVKCKTIRRKHGRKNLCDLVLSKDFFKKTSHKRNTK